MPVFDLGNFGEESDTDDDGESDSREGVSQPAAPVERVRDCTPVLIECERRPRPAAAPAPAKKPRGAAWTDADDEQLRNLVKQHGTGDWAKIAAGLPGHRSGRAAESR